MTHCIYRDELPLLVYILEDPTPFGSGTEFRIAERNPKMRYSTRNLDEVPVLTNIFCEEQ